MNKKDGEFMFGPPPHPSKATDKLKEPKPKSLREVPGYLSRLCGKFFFRLIYMFGLVWDAKPWILFVMDGEFDNLRFYPDHRRFISAGILNASRRCDHR